MKAVGLHMTNANLARMLLDMHDKSSSPSIPGPSSSAGLKFATSTPAHLSGVAPSPMIGVSPIESQQHGGEMSHSTDRFVSEEGQSDDELEISIDYKQDEEFLYFDPTNSDEGRLDESWHPVVSYKSKKKTDGLKLIAGDEEIHGRMQEDLKEAEEEDVPSFTRSGLHKVAPSAKEAGCTQLYIVTETRLRDLALEARSHCRSCQQPNAINISKSGTSAHITWKCSEGHTTSFCCQETIQRSHVADLKLGAALLLSGNNYRKVALMFAFMNLNMIHPNTFHSYQLKFVFPVIDDMASGIFQQSRDKCLGKKVVVLGDGRNDSPGHSAQYLTYTFMDNATKEILHVEFMDKRETNLVSTNMEPKALQKGLDFLHESGVEVSELVTDAHTTVAARMRQNYKNIKHSYDVWHGAKNLGKKLAKASLIAANRQLVKWQQDITNHFWFCSRTCKGSEALLKEKWRGLLHHVCGKHEWTSGGSVGLGQCELEPLEKPREDYLTPGEAPHSALMSITMDKRFLNNMEHYVNFRHTGELESLHNHILMYAAKRFAYGYPAYRARNLLAMIDYVKHIDRPVKKDADGNDKYVARWSKRAKDYVAIKERVNKTYNYIPDMMASILETRLEDMTPLHVLPPMMQDDPRHIAPRLAPKPPPPVASILQKRFSRFGGEETVDD